nr:hypothetical protein Itr_chr08CG00960 [Ipomoea trifida]
MQQNDLMERSGQHILPILPRGNLEMYYPRCHWVSWKHRNSAEVKCSWNSSKFVTRKALLPEGHCFSETHYPIQNARWEATESKSLQTRVKEGGRKVHPNYLSDFGVKGVPASLPTRALKKRSCYLKRHGCQELHTITTGDQDPGFDSIQKKTRRIEKPAYKCHSDTDQRL